MGGKLKSSFRIAPWRGLFTVHSRECAVSGSSSVLRSAFRRIVLLVAMVLTVSGFTTSVMAGSSYELVVGEKFEVCRVYKENLESFDFAMEGGDCSRKVNPQFPDLRKPRWEELDLVEYEVLVERVAEFFDDSAQLERGLVQLRDHDVLSIKQTQVDIDNNGQPETIVRYRKGRCDETNLYAAPVVALIGNQSTVDRDKTSLLLQNPQRNGSFVGRWLYGMYDIFLYRNRTYFDVWSGHEKNALSVYEVSKGQTHQVCRYRIHR